MLSHMHMGIPYEYTHTGDVPYAHGTIYAYGAEHYYSDWLGQAQVSDLRELINLTQKSCRCS